MIRELTKFQENHDAVVNRAERNTSGRSGCVLGLFIESKARVDLPLGELTADGNSDAKEKCGGRSGAVHLWPVPCSMEDALTTKAYLDVRTLHERSRAWERIYDETEEISPALVAACGSCASGVLCRSQAS